MSDEKKIIEDRYLGDGVYASFDGFYIWLDTRAQRPVNRIALEPEVLSALDHYRTELRAMLSNQAEEKS